MTQFQAINPSTGTIYAIYNIATPEEVQDVVAKARAAFPKWRNTSRVYRADLFDKLAQLIKRDHDKLKETISIETGKNLNESHAEVIEALHMCQYVAACGRQPHGYTIASELDTKDACVLRKPRGVVAIISPWNFPLAIGSFWSAGPALLEGNVVVHKPSELTPKVNQLAHELYLEAGFPDGVFHLVQGDGSTGSALVRADVDVILFTGSAEVGQDIRRHCAETWHKTCSVECGSKSSTILFEDGDFDLAMQVMPASAFKLSGQRCVSSSRLLVQRSIYQKFCETFTEYVTTKVGVSNPFDSCDKELVYGPMIDKNQLRRVMEFNQLTREDPDVKVLVDGTNPGDLFLTPHVYTCEWANKPFLKTEVFGPHVAIIPFNDLDDAVRIYNDTDYGLALGVITDDFRKHRRLVQECQTGMLYINGGSIAAESHLPFGGVGKSGNGHKSAAGTYKAVTEEIAVTTNYEKGRVTWAQGMK